MRSRPTKRRRGLSLCLFWIAAAFFLDLSPPPDLAQSVPRNNARQALAIVVNRSNPVGDLSFAELRRIFLGERSHWPGGHRVIVVMMEPGSLERDIALRDLFQMNESAYRNYFLKQSYTGNIPTPPKTLSSPEIVRKFIFNAPGAIGYLRASDVTDAVKVIGIDGRLPDDPGYRFQVEGAAK